MVAAALAVGGAAVRKWAVRFLGEPGGALGEAALELRATLARFVRAAAPSAHVLAFDEIPDTTRLRLAGTVE